MVAGDVVEDDAALDDDGGAADGDGVVEGLEVDGDGDEVLGPDGGGRGVDRVADARGAGLCGLLLLGRLERAGRGEVVADEGQLEVADLARADADDGCVVEDGLDAPDAAVVDVGGGGEAGDAGGDGEAEGELERADGLVVGRRPERVRAVDEQRGLQRADAADAGLVAAHGDGDGLCGQALAVGVELCADNCGRGSARAAATTGALTALDADGRQAEIAGVGEEALALVACGR